MADVAVHAEGLVKTYSSRARKSRRSAASTCGSRPARSSASSGRTAPGSRRRCGCSRRCCRSRRARAQVAGVDVAERPRRGAPPDRRRAAGGGARPAPDRARAAGPAGAAVRPVRRGGRRPRRRAARAGRARGRGRPPHQGLLGRHEAPARPRLGARAPARGAVPRRADDGPRPRQPAHGLGRGAADQRARHDRVPDHAVPRGGRRSCATGWRSSTTAGSCARARPPQLKAELRERLGLDSDPTLDDVFLDATGRTRSRVAGDVQEVSA